MRAMPRIDPTLLRPLLGDRAGRFDVDALDTCDSTSSELLRRAEHGTPSGTVVVADHQTAGRGRRGRVWLSHPDDSLTFSLLWRFADHRQLAGLSLAVGIALARALGELGATGVRLKWPNDLLVETDGHFAKLGGVLVELTHDRRSVTAVIGIGLNLRPPTGELPQPATGLDRQLMPLPERHALLAALLRELANVLDTLATGSFACLRDEWQRRHAWQGREVRLLGDGEAPRHGRCLGVDNDGALLLTTATGTGTQRILSGDVSLRPA